MKNSKLSLFIISLILLFKKLISQNIKFKSSAFVPINSHEQTLFQLNTTQPEVYFLFDNKYANSDLIFTIKYAKQYTARAYIYDSISNIKTNSNNSYIDYLKEIDLSEKISFIKTSEIAIEKKIYYIIIKDLLNYSTKDYITVYNEQDEIDFSEETPFIANYFFSKNLYTLYFNGKIDEEIILEFNINNISFIQNVIITLNEEEIYEDELNKGIIKFNENKNVQGIYKIFLSSSKEELYTFIKTSIVLTKEKNKVIELHEDRSLQLTYSLSKIFNFFINIDVYDYNEENIITFIFTHNVYKNNLIKYCYAKTMNFEEYNDDIFYNNMPRLEEENEADFSRINSLDNIYHLYFRKTKLKEKGNLSYLLLQCSIEIPNEINYFYPENFKIFVGKRAFNFDLSYKRNIDKVNITFSITLSDSIPTLIKVKFPGVRILSYVFYVSNKLQTVYENSMIGADHKNENINQIYPINYDKENINQIIYLKLFGAKQNVNFRIESTTSLIYYLNNEKRPKISLPIEHLNCGDSFYFIGSYSDLTDQGYIFIEKIYGKFQIYFRDVIKSDDLNILTNENEKYLINNITIFADNTFDIIEIKCISPGYFNLHLFQNQIYKSIYMYSRYIYYLNSGSFTFYPKITNESQTNINLEISDLLGKDLDISLCFQNNNNYFINNLKSSYKQFKYDTAADVPNITIYVKNETVISIKLTDDYLYKFIDNENFYTNEQRILFKIENNTEYKNINITLKNDYINNYNYSYALYKGDPYFSTDLILSNYYYYYSNQSNNINLIISNPYTKPYPMIADNENSTFYLMLFIDNSNETEINFNYNPIDQYDKIIFNKTKIFINETQKYSIDISKNISTINIIYQSCGQSLNKINIYNYDDIINFFTINENISTTYYLASFNNYNIDSQISIELNNNIGNPYRGAVIGITTSNITKNDIDFYNNIIMNITQIGKKVIWQGFREVFLYDIYIFEENYTNMNYTKNPCFLEIIKNDNSSDDSVKHFTTNHNDFDLNEKGIFIIIIVANIEGKTPLKFIYDELKFDSSLVNDENVSTVVLIILGILGIVVILVLISLIIVYLIKSEVIKLPETTEKLLRDTTNTLG